jgi:hypothetical protein
VTRLWRILMCWLGFLRLVPHGRTVGEAGIWRYHECERCGKRSAECLAPLLVGPKKERWLNGGAWEEPPPRLPRNGPQGGTGVVRPKEA